MYLPVGFANLPSHADKRKLAIPKLRAPSMVRWARKSGRTILGIVELATISRVMLKALPWWTVVDAAYNNVFRGGTNKLGNSLMFRKRHWELVRKHTLHIDWGPGHPRGLNMLVALLENKNTHERCWFIVWHAPRQAIDKTMNLRVRQAVVAEAKRLFEEYHFPVVIMGDINGKLADELKGGDWSVGEAQEVVIIAGLGVSWKDGAGDHVNFSDHVALRANGTARM